MGARPYRAKLENSNKWVEGNYLHLNDGLECELDIIVDAAGQYKRIDISTLGQSTGYLDKLGRVVYEGDIIKDDDIEAPLVVGFEENLAAYAGTSLDNKVVWMLHELQNSGIEIIGNVHEEQTELGV